jgi:hypothetical protein
VTYVAKERALFLKINDINDIAFFGTSVIIDVTFLVILDRWQLNLLVTLLTIRSI